MKHPKHYDTDAATSKRMSNVKLKNGVAEKTLAQALWHEGYRYRLNDRRLPGSPDIAILRFKIAVFVDGEFWHGKNWEIKKQTIKRNREYWIEKIEENIARDYRNDKLLETLEWTPVHFWSKDILQNVTGCIQVIQEIIWNNKLAEIDEDKEIY